MSRGTGGGDPGLVPLSDRLRYMQAFRLTVCGLAVLRQVVLPDGRSLGPSLGAMTVGYVALTLVTPRLFALRRDAALRMFGLTLLVDALYIGCISYGTRGFGDPLQYLVLLHLITVTLLASFRTGVKLAVWHSLLATSVLQLADAGVISSGHPTPHGDAAEVAVLLGVVWLGTLFTATFASVNERELRRRNYDLQALARLAWRLESALQPEEVGQALVEAVAEDFDVTRMVLLVRRGDTLVPLASRDRSATDPASAPEADLLIAQALRQRRTLRLAAPRAEENPWLVAAMPDADNLLALPLFAEGTPVGVLVVDNGRERGARIQRRAVEMLERFVSQTSLALANAWLLARVRALATMDGLTGVGNRRSFDSALPAVIDRATAAGTPVALVLFDVDHFKRLNDTYGHQVGDDVLQRVAGTLRGAARTTDLVARYGGEEFVMLLPDTDLPTALGIAERLRVAVEQAGVEPRVTASLGVAAFPHSAVAPAALVAAADEALYAAKGEGRNRVIASTRRVLDPSVPAARQAEQPFVPAEGS